MDPGWPRVARRCPEDPRHIGDIPVVDDELVPLVGNTVTVTRIGFLCLAKAARTFSKTMRSCEIYRINSNNASLSVCVTYR